MKQLIFPRSNSLSPDVLKRINDATLKLGAKFGKVAVKNLNISEYNQRYFQTYIDNYSFYSSIYTQLLINAIKELKQAVDQSILVDYGGGSGMLSFLAKEAGFMTVIYNDIYKVSVDDVRKISLSLEIPIDHFIEGDAEEVVDYLNSKDIHPDLICSMDVLEHIYSVKTWFTTITKLNCDFSLVFMTSANACNPIINRKLRKVQLRDEYKGTSKYWGWKDRDMNKPFLQAREEIIQDYDPGMNVELIHFLAKCTRGLIKEDIEKLLEEYHDKGEIQYRPEHSTNTCDPYTGNWSEKILKPAYLKEIVESNGLKFEIRNSYYSYSDRGFVNLAKTMINYIISFIPSNILFFSPAYVLIARKIKKI